jgi:hypothetical protein
MPFGSPAVLWVGSWARLPVGVCLESHVVAVVVVGCREEQSLVDPLVFSIAPENLCVGPAIRGVPRL